MKLSLCIIARDEESMLPGCLESVRGVVDEIVLVDTGSRDKTIKIAEKAGARVFKAPWRDDFSAPRNLSVARARGTWILQLDADERLAPGAGDRIKAALEGADFDCGLIRLHNATRLDASADDVISGKERLGEAMSLPRLLRRTNDLRYEGIVHESIARWLRDRGGRARFIDADIVHLGSIPELRRDRKKVSRNVDLLRKRAETEPTDFTAWSYLAFESLAQGKLAEAKTAADAGWLIALRPDRLAGTSVLRLAVAKGLIEKEHGQHHATLETVRVGETIDGRHPDFCMLRGTAYESLALAAPRASKLRASYLGLALEAHRAALDLASTDYIQRFLVGAGSWASRMREGTVLLQLGDAKKARETLTVGVAQKPDEREALFALAEAEIADGAYEQALARLERFLGDRPDGWILAALACERLGAVSEALAFARQASSRTSVGYLAPHRKEMHLEVMGLAGAYAGAPSSGPGPVGALTALMARAPFESAHVRFDVSKLPIDSIVRNLVQNQRFALLDGLLSARAEAAFPGIKNCLTSALRALGVEVEKDESPSPIIVASEHAFAASFVRRVLSAHPRMTDRGMFEKNTSAAKGDETREIFGTTSLAHASEIAKLLPRATIVFVSIRPANEASKEQRVLAEVSGERSIELPIDLLLDDPLPTLASLLAGVGETADDGPLRVVIESYPGRTRDWRVDENEDRAERAARTSDDSVRSASPEVFP